MPQSVKHDSCCKKVGVKPQIGTVTDNCLHKNAENHVYMARVGGTGTERFSVNILCTSILI